MTNGKRQLNVSEATKIIKEPNLRGRELVQVLTSKDIELIAKELRGTLRSENISVLILRGKRL